MYRHLRLILALPIQFLICELTIGKYIQCSLSLVESYLVIYAYTFVQPFEVHHFVCFLLWSLRLE